MGLGSIFGGTKKTTQENSQTTGFNLPEWFKTALGGSTQEGISLLDQLQGTTANERIQGFNPDELTAQNRIRQGTGQYDDIVGGALSTMQQAQQRAFEGVRPEDIQKFMNPYTQTVLDNSKREMVRQTDMQRNQLDAQAAAAGAFGGSRQAIQRGMLNEDLNTNLNDMQYKGLQDSYAQALNAARQSTSDTINAGNAIGNLATQGQNLYNQDSQLLSASGATQRGLEQAKTDFTYTNPLQSIYQQQQLMAGAAPLYGQTTTGTTTSSTPSAGWGSSLLGGALAAASLGTGGGTTLGGTLLSGVLNKKDGGPIQKFAEGGPVKPSEKLNPLDSFLNQMPEGILTPPVEAGQIDPVQTPATATEELLSLPQTVFTTKPMKRPVMSELPEENVDTSKMGMTPRVESGAVANQGLEAMISDKPLTEQKSRLQRMMDDTNLPLLKMGLTMMASDKSFFEAFAEGGLAGANQMATERAGAASAAEKQTELANTRAIEEMKAANESVKNANADANKKQALSIEALKAEGYLKNAEAQAEYARRRGTSDKEIQNAKTDAAKAAQTAYNNSINMGMSEEEAALARTTAFNSFMENVFGSQNTSESGNIGNNTVVAPEAPPVNTTSNILSVEDVLNGKF